MKYLLILSFLLSCSSTTKRKLTMVSTVVFKGGRHNDKQWEDTLIFKRHSWFNEVTMAYDLMYTKMDDTSPFYNWLGSERLRASQCDSFYLAMIYTRRQEVIKRATFMDQLEAAGYKEITVTDAAYEVRSHKGFSDWKLSSHKIFGICAAKNAKHPVEMVIPGYTNERIFK